MTLYERALIFAIKAHGDQKRKYTGEPYIIHPIRVAAHVRESGASTAAIGAALLHDVLEDTATTHGRLVDEFGEYVARLVYQITDVSKPSDGNRRTRKELDCQRLALADSEAQTIKACDIIDNAFSVIEHDPDFARVYIPEKRAQIDVLTLADPRLIEEARRLLA